jgi:hypothetical protein
LSNIAKEIEDMNVRYVIGGACYGPQALRIIYQAFDEAWASIADNFGPDTHDIRKSSLEVSQSNVVDCYQCQPRC